MRKHKYLLLIIFTLSTALFLAFYEKEDSQKVWEKHVKDNYKTFAMAVPDSFAFCGEAVPLSRVDVRESFDLEVLKNVYWHSNTYLMIKRANRWFPVIEKILQKNDIPLDFKYLALIESNLSNVVSPAGAAGYWQIMKSTGKEYGLEVSEEVDERYHVEKATEVACLYFKESYEKFQSWTLVAASYNMGMSGVERRLDEQQVSSYYDLYLNAETARYVYRILAAKMILNQPDAFGFNLRKNDLYLPIPTHKIKVNYSVDSWVDFAVANGVTYKTLKYFNPWIRDRKLHNPQAKVYDIELPQNEFYNYSSLYEEGNK